MAEDKKPDLSAQYDAEPESDPLTGDVDGPAASGAPLPASTTSPTDRGPDGRFLPREAQPATTTQPPHSRYLTQQALDLGLSDAEIRDTPSEVLGERVYQMQKQALAEARANSIAKTVQPDKPWTADAPEPTPVPDDLDLSEEEFDPRIVKLAKRLKAQDAELAKLKAGQHEIQQERAAKAHLTFVERADDFFAKHPSIFGAGKADAVKPGTKEHVRRVTVWEQAKKDTSAKPWEEKLAAAASLFYELSREPEEYTPSEREREWLESGLARPTHRKSDELPNGPKKAERSVAALQREMGAKEESGSASEDDFL